MSCLAPMYDRSASAKSFCRLSKKNIRDEDMLARVVSSLTSYQLSCSMIVESKCMSKGSVEAEARQDGLHTA